MSGKHSFLTL